MRITLNRPESRNAQNRRMLVELNDAFLRAENGRLACAWSSFAGSRASLFSSGHDLELPEST